MGWREGGGTRLSWEDNGDRREMRMKRTVSPNSEANKKLMILIGFSGLQTKGERCHEQGTGRTGAVNGGEERKVETIWEV